MRVDASTDEWDRPIGNSMRRASRLGLIAVATVIVVGGCLLSVAGVSAAAQRRTSPRNSSLGTATGLLNLAFADARAKGSFHQALTQVVGGVRGALVDDVTVKAGRQQITSSDGTRAKVEVIGNTAYVTGNQHALKRFFKFTNNEISVIGSNWVSIPSTNTAFASIAYDVTLPTALAEVAPSGHLTEGHTTTIDGQRVIPINGSVPTAFAGGTGGKATIYVTESSDPLPIRASLQVTQADHKKLELTGTMGDWGERVAVSPPRGRQLSDTQINALVAQLAELAIPGQPGYFALDGQHGKPALVGRPWGQPCKPVRVAVERNVPDWIYAQVAAVVGKARKQGIDVTVETRRLGWDHGSLYYRHGQSPATTVQVEIGATGPTASPTAKSKLPLQLTWKTTLDADRHNEHLTSVAGTFSLPVVDGKPQTVRRSIRQLIAWTQGIFETTDPISGITPRSFTDRFTEADVAAMLAMSGCARPTGNIVTGIAA